MDSRIHQSLDLPVPKLGRNESASHVVSKTHLASEFTLEEGKRRSLAFLKNKFEHYKRGGVNIKINEIKLKKDFSQLKGTLSDKKKQITDPDRKFSVHHIKPAPLLLSHSLRLP